MDFKAVGISYHTAPLQVREAVTLSEDEGKAFLLTLKETLDLGECLVVSTCNRTEVYYSSAADRGKEIISLLCLNQAVKFESLTSYLRKFDGVDTINHLFEVSLGLDSKVLGDIQISNQIKRAYQASTDLNLAGPFLHRLMHTIFFANKKVVQETRLQDGKASTASVSVDLIKRFVENVNDPKVLLIGLGEIGQNVLDNLRELDVQIGLANRTKSRADKLAKSSNIKVEDYNNLGQVIKSYDTIISAVTVNEEIIRPDMLEDGYQHKLFIDLSVPRSISPDIDNVHGVSLYNVDQLSEKTEKVKKIRESAVPTVKEIISDSMKSFEEWKEEMEVSPTIQKLKNTLDEIRRQELSRHIGKVSEDEMALLEVVTKNMIQKVIKLPVIQLKAACRRGESENLVGVLNDLFNLEPDPVKKG